MKTHTIILIFLLALASCKSENSGSTEVSRQNSDSTEVSNEENIPKILGIENIPSQDFIISSETDTILIGKHGTKIKIESGIFIDSFGSKINGNIKIELKECLDRYSMVLGGLTTMSNGEILESGGMICLNAKYQNQKLSLKRNSTIQVEVPTASFIKGMHFFEGVSNRGKINWVNPAPLANTQRNQKNLKAKLDSALINFRTDTIYIKQKVSYKVDVNGEKVSGERVPKNVQKKMSELINSGNGLVITKDSSIIIDGYNVYLYKNDKLEKRRDYIYKKKWVTWVSSGSMNTSQDDTGSINTFQVDKNLSYIFNIKKLGWANIDRFFRDKRTKKIDWFASINGYEEYSDVYVSLIFENQNILLPGYVKDDGTFSFTHGDYEKTALPVGENATIIVTAYKKTTPYYSIKKLKITEKHSIILDLVKTTLNDLTKSLIKQI